MGKDSHIQWTDNTWNPWLGCLRISPGCQKCYMYRDQTRYGNDPKEVRRSKTKFNEPLKWKEPAKVFTCSWSDWFIEYADSWRDEAWAIIRQTPHLIYQILTKRPENIVGRLPDDWDDGWPNVWLGVSVESVRYRDRISILDYIPAKVRFVSYEPALGPVDFSHFLSNGALRWVISGGESGYDPRPANVDWFRQARDDCQKFKVPYFHKQNGGSQMVDGAWGGRLLDGIEWNEFPQP